MTMRGEANMTLGYFASTSLRDYFMSPSYYYYTSKLIWMVPPGRLVSSLDKLIRPFQQVVWAWFLLVLGIALLAAALVQHSELSKRFIFGDNVKTPFLNIINITLGGTLVKLPKRNFARSVLIMFMIYCLVIQNSYKGGLLKFMQMSVREPGLKSTDEMVAKNYSFYMTPASKAFISELPHILEMAVFLNMSDYILALDHVIDPEFKGVLLSTEDHLSYRNVKAFPNRFYRHAPETIYSNNLVVYMTKSSCLSIEVDGIIIYLVNGGLIRKWAAHYIDKRFLKRKSTSNAVSLKVNQFLGSFQLLFVGVLASSVMFALEMIFNRFKRLKK